MPAASERQRRFMGAELGRKRQGKATDTGMTEGQLQDFASKGVGCMKQLKVIRKALAGMANKCQPRHTFQPQPQKPPSVLLR